MSIALQATIAGLPLSITCWNPLSFRQTPKLCRVSPPGSAMPVPVMGLDALRRAGL
jgi:hypothetical protein